MILILKTNFGFEKQKVTSEVFLNLLKKTAEIPNSNLIRNVNYIINKMNVEQNDFARIKKKKKRIDGSKNTKNRMSY